MCGEFVDQPKEKLLAFQEGLFVLELTVDTGKVCAGEWERFSFNRSHLTPSAVCPRSGSALVTAHQVAVLISDCNSISVAHTCASKQLNSTRRVVCSCNCCCHGIGTVGFLTLLWSCQLLHTAVGNVKCRWVGLLHTAVGNVKCRWVGGSVAHCCRQC
jgi:hypothetical protein